MLDSGDDEDLVESEGDPLAQLVLFLQRVLEEADLERVHRVVVPHAGRRAPLRAADLLVARHRRQVGIPGRRGRELLLEEPFEADRRDVGDQRVRRPHRRLIEEADDVGRSTDPGTPESSLSPSATGASEARECPAAARTRRARTTPPGHRSDEPYSRRRDLARPSGVFHGGSSPNPCGYRSGRRRS